MFRMSFLDAIVFAAAQILNLLFWSIVAVSLYGIGIIIYVGIIR